MRILELTIQNVRGLPDLHLVLDGQNLVIWGPNGSGKSCVVDAIDFLFTGRISRLLGEGTAGITLARHGSHIDHEVESALVKAIVQLEGFSEPVEISRCMGNPDHLDCPDEAKESLASTSGLMSRGGIILTRRDILRYVAAEAGKRADEIEVLLHITDVDDVRSGLVRARTELRRKEKSAGEAIETAKAQVNVTLGLAKYSDEGLLEHVNTSRQALGGMAVESNMPSSFKEGLAAPILPEISPSSANPILILQAVQNIKKGTDLSLVPSQADTERNLRESITKLRQKPELLAELEHLELTENAARFVDDSTVECPVCGASWPEGHLKSHLETRLLSAHAAQSIREEISKHSDALLVPVRDLIANVKSLSEGLHAAGIETQEENFSMFASWLAKLKALQTALSDPTKEYLENEFSTEAVKTLFVPGNLTTSLEHIEMAIQMAVPKPSPQQTAWDKLTRLEESASSLENRVEEGKTAARHSLLSGILVTEYEKARDAVLEGLYSRIADRFVEFYCLLHDHESEHFDASLNPRKASLDFEVDFLGRGTHPPQALHSEGHQDSMGVCLFLALNEELAKENVSLIVLDDVMMSVDTGHRKDVCGLLNEQFGDRQFVITTHDRTWANQLKQEGVVKPGQVMEFTGWTVENGPHTHRQINLWDEIQSDLELENISSAAFKLRRSSEDYFESVCDALGAKLTYNSDMRWQLDDWLPAAMDEYKNLLRRAKGAASSWGNQEAVENLSELESIRSQVHARTHAEQWAINASVHFNNWENLSKQDFTPVVEAFKDLQTLFECANCSRMLEKLPRKGAPQSVKCSCGATSWNLSHKSN